MEYLTDEVVYSSQAELTAHLNAKAQEGWRLVHIDRRSPSPVVAYGAWVVFERKQHKPRPSWEREQQHVPDPLPPWYPKVTPQRQRVPGTAGTWHAFSVDEETGECRVCMDEEGPQQEHVPKPSPPGTWFPVGPGERWVRGGGMDDAG